MATIPQKLTNFRVYAEEDQAKLIGTADVTLPSIEFQTDTLKGAERSIVRRRYDIVCCIADTPTRHIQNTLLRHNPGIHVFHIHGIPQDSYGRRDAT